MNTEIPIVSHPKLPEGVPLVASFSDDRNRLSYYFPRLRELDGVKTPLTGFFEVGGDYDSYPDIEYREITRFMQERGLNQAFVRGDFSSGKFDGDSGSKVTSQDPYDIETVVLELFRQLSRSKRHLGKRIAVREWVPHNREVRYFIRDGEVVYGGSLDEGDDFPEESVKAVAEEFSTFAWSVDFICHETTGEWYCIDMGLDGLYHSGTEWVAISEHIDESYSPSQYSDSMVGPERLKFFR